MKCIGTAIGVAAVTAILGTSVAARGTTPFDRERAIWMAVKSGKSDRFAAMLAPNYQTISSDGVQSRSSELASIRYLHITSLTLANFRTERLDSDDELVTYSADIVGTAGKTDVSGRYIVASVWHASQGRWLCAFHTELKAGR